VRAAANRHAAHDAARYAPQTLMPMPTTARQFVVCLRNEGYEAALERRKIYRVLPDPDAAKHRQIRVIDESGDDYLYPKNFFAPLELPQAVRRALLAAA
jgi:hypothetical protein